MDRNRATKTNLLRTGAVLLLLTGGCAEDRVSQRSAEDQTVEVERFTTKLVGNEGLRRIITANVEVRGSQLLVRPYLTLLRNNFAPERNQTFVISASLDGKDANLIPLSETQPHVTTYVGARLFGVEGEAITPRDIDGHRVRMEVDNGLGGRIHNIWLIPEISGGCLYESKAFFTNAAGCETPLPSGRRLTVYTFLQPSGEYHNFLQGTGSLGNPDDFRIATGIPIPLGSEPRYNFQSFVLPGNRIRPQINTSFGLTGVQPSAGFGLADNGGFGRPLTPAERAAVIDRLRQQAVKICPVVGNGFSMITDDELLNLQRLPMKHLTAPRLKNTRLANELLFDLPGIPQNSVFYQDGAGTIQFGPKAEFGDFHVLCTKIPTPLRSYGVWEPVVSQNDPQFDGNLGLLDQQGEAVYTYGTKVRNQGHVIATVKAAEPGAYDKEVGLVAKLLDADNYYHGSLIRTAAGRNVLRIVKVQDGQAKVLGQREITKQPLYANPITITTFNGFADVPGGTAIQTDNVAELTLEFAGPFLTLRLRSLTDGFTTMVNVRDDNPLPAGKTGLRMFMAAGQRTLQTNFRADVVKGDFVSFGNFRVISPEGIKGVFQNPGFADGRPIYEGDPRFHPFVFNINSYRTFNQDLNRAFGESFTRLTQHWIHHGVGEGRRASGIFQSPRYLQVNPDVAASPSLGSRIGSMVHYVLFGIVEGRNTGFDRTRQLPDVQPATAL